MHNMKRCCRCSVDLTHLDWAVTSQNLTTKAKARACQCDQPLAFASALLVQHRLPTFSWHEHSQSLAKPITSHNEQWQCS